MPRDPALECNRVTALDLYRFFFFLKLLPSPGRHVLVFIAEAQTFHIKVLHIAARIGESPGDMIAAPQDDGWNRRNCRPNGVDCFTIRLLPAHMGQIPQSRRIEPQMRVVGEQRLAGIGTRPVKHPVIRRPDTQPIFKGGSEISVALV